MTPTENTQTHVVKKILYILAILLFVSSYSICDYFYYNDDIKDIGKWWGLKSNIYAIIIALTFYASSINVKGVSRLVLNIGVGMALSNVIDKCFFNVLDFNYNDIIMVMLTVLLSTLNYLKELKNAK